MWILQVKFVSANLKISKQRRKSQDYITTWCLSLTLGYLWSAKKIIMETIDFCRTRGGGMKSSKVDKWWGQNEYVYTLCLVLFSLYLAQKYDWEIHILKVDKGKIR